MRRRLWWGLWICLFFYTASAVSQELNAKVTINSERLGSNANAETFKTLERQLSDLLNLTRWTTATFSFAERIDCTFSINLTEVKDESRYKAELFVTSRRPIYNSSYFSPQLIWRDQELNFEYNQFDPIEYNETDLQSNLVASVVFYAYFVLAMDFDSFSPLGGNSARSMMRQIVARAQAKQDWSGWKAFESTKNRYALAEAMNDAELETLRRFWYDYHRRALDEMVGNPNRGRTTVLELLPQLEAVYKVRPMSPLLSIFAAVKLDEIVNILSKANASEKQDAYKILNKVFPTEGNKLNPLKK